MVFVLKEAADYILASFTLHLDPETTTSKNTSTIRLQITIKMTIFNLIIYILDAFGAKIA
jgi:hypothetical protein